MWVRTRAVRDMFTLLLEKLVITIIKGYEAWGYDMIFEFQNLWTSTKHSKPLIIPDIFV